jgi:hypothetical protein
MSTPLDYPSFNLRCAQILAQMNEATFDDLVVQIQQLQQEQQEVSDGVARQYVDRSIAELMLSVSIHTRQPSDVVEHWFRYNVSQGFVSLWSETHRTIDYAAYCRNQDRVAAGRLVLSRLEERLLAILATQDSPHSRYLLRATRGCSRHLGSG